MKHLLLTLSFATFLSAGSNSTPLYTSSSTNNQTPSPSGGHSSSLAQPSKTLDYRDTDDFDTQLSQMTTNKAETIAIVVSQRFDPKKGETPERLARWLGVLQKGNGTQEYEEIKDPNAMNPLLKRIVQWLAFEWAMNWWEGYREQQKYLPIQGYHARFCYRKYDNMVDKVVFVRKDVDSNRSVCFR